MLCRAWAGVLGWAGLGWFRSGRRKQQDPCLTISDLGTWALGHSGTSWAWAGLLTTLLLLVCNRPYDWGVGWLREGFLVDWLTGKPASLL